MYQRASRQGTAVSPKTTHHKGASAAKPAASVWRTVLKSLGCSRITWAGWAIIFIFVLFTAITVRLLILKRARQMSRTERELFPIDDNHALSLLSAGSDPSPYLFILVHGASRDFQSAEHWLPHMVYFAKLGRVYAVDMLGHGYSVPGKEEQLKRSIHVDQQVLALEKLIFERKQEGQKLVLVGRSYGGRIVLNLANKLREGDVHKIVLIAPAIHEEEVSSLRQEVKSLPMLFVWAQDDKTVPYSRKKELLEEFTEKEVLLFDHVLQQGQEEWLAHTPENLKAEEFQSKLKSWL